MKHIIHARKNVSQESYDGALNKKAVQMFFQWLIKISKDEAVNFVTLQTNVTSGVGDM